MQPIFTSCAKTTCFSQRDLTDSTVLRNQVLVWATLIAYQATLKGVSKLEVNEERLLAELDQNWEL